MGFIADCFTERDSLANQSVSAWENWFAWRPVYVGNRLSKDGRAGRLGWAWNEWIERRPADVYEGASVSCYWLYRRPGQRLAGVAGNEWSD